MKRDFVRLPSMWQHELFAMKANGATWRVAVTLLKRAKFTHRVRLSNIAAAKIGVSRQTKWRAIDALRKRGLIIVSGRAGTSPTIKVLFRDWE